VSGETIYLGNIPYEVSEDELRGLCETFGEVFSVKIIKDFETSQSRGFAFCTYITEGSAFKAVMELDGRKFQERVLKVSQARPRQTPRR